MRQSLTSHQHNIGHMGTERAQMAAEDPTVWTPWRFVILS